MNKTKSILGSISLILAINFLWFFLIDWILSFVQNLLGLWLLIGGLLITLWTTIVYTLGKNAKTKVKE